MEAVDAQRGLGIVVQDQPHGWIIESMRFHGLNVVSIEVATGKRTLIISAYLPPSTLDHLTDLKDVLPHFQDQDPTVLGYLNVNLQSRNLRSQQVYDLLMEFGLVDLRHHLSTMASPNH